MCEPFSCIVTKERVLWSKGSESHEDIIEEHGLKSQSLFTPDFVRCELHPPGWDYSTDPVSWSFVVDQDFLPIWFDSEEVAARVIREAHNWKRYKVLTPDVQIIYGKGANLARAEMVEANLAKANLAKANLSGADLHQADLRGANLIEASLVNTDLCGANLEGVYLSEANLSKAYLYKAKLQYANLGRADLYGARLRGANLRGAILGGANLQDADLGETDLSGARWDETTKWPEGIGPLPKEG